MPPCVLNSRHSPGSRPEVTKAHKETQPHSSETHRRVCSRGVDSAPVKGTFMSFLRKALLWPNKAKGSKGFTRPPKSKRDEKNISGPVL